MTTGYKLQQRLKQVNIARISGDIAMQHSDEIIALNRKQLLAGKNAKGEDLPTYESDPFFKKPGSWQRYAAWKKKLFPETPYGVANFIITGVYHRSITLGRTDTALIFDATASFAASVAGKTGNRALGLTNESKSTAFKEIIRSPLIRQVSAITGFKSK